MIFAKFCLQVLHLFTRALSHVSQFLGRQGAHPKLEAGPSPGGQEHLDPSSLILAVLKHFEHVELSELLQV